MLWKETSFVLPWNRFCYMVPQPGHWRESSKTSWMEHIHACYAVFNKSWKQHPAKEELYGNIPVISEIVRERRTKYAGHCYRSKDELVGDLLLWIPNHGHSSIGRPRRTYIDKLSNDVGMPVDDLKPSMEDRDVWRERVRLVQEIRPIR